MIYEIVPSSYSCGAEVFTINGKDADTYDFGEFYDSCPELAPEYGCGDRKFQPKPAELEILERYNITHEEYEEICEALQSELHIGRCAMCC